MSNIASSLETERHQFLYVGMDIHKDNHTAVAVNCFGQNILEFKVANSKKDFQALTTTVKQLSKQKGLKPVFGLEDSYGYGVRIAKYLYLQNLPVKMIPPVLVDRARSRETHPEKTDSLDALQAAKVLIQRIDTLPNYSISRTDEIAKEIKELSIDRDFLVKERARLKNQLHRLLHKSYNSRYQERFKDPFSLKALRYWRRRPVPQSQDDVVGEPFILKNQIRRKVKRLLQIREELKNIEAELEVLIKQSGQKLETMNGCGIPLAAKVLAEIRNIERFGSPHALAKYAGLCPRERSSGKAKKHIKTKSGNRQLNMAIHRIALSQISRSGNNEAKEYFQRKVSEGKTKSQALCCLKRRLIDIIFMMLKYKQSYNYSG
jgi:transposase